MMYASWYLGRLILVHCRFSMDDRIPEKNAHLESNDVFSMTLWGTSRALGVHVSMIAFRKTCGLVRMALPGQGSKCGLVRLALPGQGSKPTFYFVLNTTVFLYYLSYIKYSRRNIRTEVQAMGHSISVAPLLYVATVQYEQVANTALSWVWPLIIHVRVVFRCHYNTTVIFLSSPNLNVPLHLAVVMS